MSLAGPSSPTLVSAEGVTGPSSPRRRGKSARAREDRRTGYLLISPTVIIVFTMVVLPILWTISLGFQQIRLLNLRSAGFIGDYSLENFRRQQQVNRILFACLEELAIENARLERLVKEQSGPR